MLGVEACVIRGENEPETYSPENNRPRIEFTIDDEPHLPVAMDTILGPEQPVQLTRAGQPVFDESGSPVFTDRLSRELSTVDAHFGHFAIEASEQNLQRVAEVGIPLGEVVVRNTMRSIVSEMV